MCKPGKFWVEKVWTQLTNPCESHQIGNFHVDVDFLSSSFSVGHLVVQLVSHLVYFHVGHFLSSLFLSASMWSTLSTSMSATMSATMLATTM